MSSVCRTSSISHEILGFDADGNPIDYSSCATADVSTEKEDIQKGRQRSSLMFWGAKFIQFLAALAILPRKTVKNRMSSSFCFKSSWCKSSYSSNRPVQNSSAARNLMNSAPQTKATTFVFSSVFILLLCVSTGYCTTPGHS